MTTILLAWVNDEIAVKLRSSDSEIFARLIESLKDAVASCERRYSPQDRQWFIADTARGDLEAWLNDARTLFGACVEGQKRESKSESGKRKPPPKQPKQPSAHEILHLQKTAPPELIRAAYKCLSQIYHPDKPGGDTFAMQRINIAYRQLSA